MKFWKYLPPQFAHDIAPKGLKALSYFTPKTDIEYNAFKWRGLSFKNPIGIAGGVDKDGVSLETWQHFGAGFLEVGTVTPLPQSPNPKPILKRYWNDKVLWNKMGFPNSGAEKLKNNLLKYEIDVPLFINVGKNRITSLDEAANDYLCCMDILAAHADAFVINISSPNTKNLRDLANKSHLNYLLKKIDEKQKELSQKFNKSFNIFLKLSPDMNEDNFLETIETSINNGINGFILTNTTSQRNATKSSQTSETSYPKEGGLSGACLKDLSLSNLNKLVTHLGQNSDKLIISVGGILSAEDIQERLDMGANLVQCYAALIFEGPNFFKNSLKKLSKIQ